MLSTECGHTFCAECLEQWLDIRAKQDPEWTPEYLDMVLKLGMDPRTAVDGLPILELLTSALFTSSSAGISRQSRDSLQVLAFQSEEEILGPRFNCPTCRNTLLSAPVRPFLLEEVLSMLPAERKDDEAEPSDGTTSGARKVDKGKAKVKAVDWSRFFGHGLGNGGEGYDTPGT